jgi:acyl carrier protein
MQDLPTGAVTEAVRAAVAREYADKTGIPLRDVELGFEGGLEFDSVLGVELSVGLEDVLQVLIPETALQTTEVFSSLSAFARAIQSCIDAAAQIHEEAKT